MELEKFIITVDDFPKKGIKFKDITPILNNVEAFQYVIDEFAKIVNKYNVDVILAPEARGFILAGAVAYKTNKRLIIARKPNKLPRNVLSVNYKYEYGKASLEIHKDDFHKNDKVFIIDDVLATFATASSLIKLVKSVDCEIIGLGFITSILDFTKIEKIKDYNCNILIS